MAHPSTGPWRRGQGVLPLPLVTAIGILVTRIAIFDALAAVFVGFTVVVVAYGLVGGVASNTVGKPRQARGVALGAILTSASATGCWAIVVPGGVAVAVGIGTVLCVVLLAGGALNCLLVALRVEPTLANAAVVVGGVMWLTWPVWLTTAPQVLIGVHPLLTINGILAADLGVWTERPVAYRLTLLGQDLAYALPTRLWPCVGVHGLVAILAGGAATLVGRLNGRPRRR